MQEKEKAAVYPYDRRFCPLLRHSGLINDLDIVSVASPNGWGLCGKDAGRADGGEDTGLIVKSSFDEILPGCDTVIFTESFNELDFKKMILPKIIKAQQAGKNIVLTMSLDEGLRKKIQEDSLKAGVYFKYYGPSEAGEDYTETAGKNASLYEINVPVVFVMGITEETHKLEIQLSLRESFKSMGYKISQVGSRSCCTLFGFHSFPDFMFSRITEAEKIVRFNRLIKKIELDEKPDIIIIGVPGGTMRIDDQFCNGFAITAYEVSQAVQPDAVVFSSLYEQYKSEYYEMINNSTKYKFGFEVDCFNLSNIKLDWESSNAEKMMVYVTLDSGFVDEKIQEYKALKSPVYNILNPHDPQKMAEFLVEKLAGYAEIGSI